jgi:hypothetical protein
MDFSGCIGATVAWGIDWVTASLGTVREALRSEPARSRNWMARC